VVVADVGPVPEADAGPVEDAVLLVELLAGVEVVLDVVLVLVVLDGEVLVDGVDERLVVVGVDERLVVVGLDTLDGVVLWVRVRVVV
jgi:hypothetical protein